MNLEKFPEDMQDSISGDRTTAEADYDAAVLRGLADGLGILEAIARANEQYPDEALQVDDSNAGDVAAYYESLIW
jgi:hypothetical protein